MDLRHIRYFIAVAEHMSFTRAAETLQIAQPNISTHIAQLEKELGVKLFSRRQKKIKLTDAGEMFLQQSRLTISQAARAAQMAKAADRGEVGTVRLGTNHTHSVYLLPWLITTLHKRLPAVEIVPCLSGLHSIVGDLEMGNLDFGIVRLPVRHTILATKVLLEDRLVAVVNAEHRYAAHKTVPLRNLRNETFVVIDRKLLGEYASWAAAACQMVGFCPQTIEEVESAPAQLAKVATGSYVALMPATAIPNVREWPDLRVKELSDVKFRIDIALAWRQSEVSAVCQMVIHELDRATSPSNIRVLRNTMGVAHKPRQ